MTTLRGILQSFNSDNGDNYTNYSYHPLLPCLLSQDNGGHTRIPQCNLLRAERRRMAAVYDRENKAQSKQLDIKLQIKSF